MQDDELRGHFKKMAEEMRRHIDSMAEGIRHELRLLDRLDNTLTTEVSGIRSEMRRGFADMEAMYGLDRPPQEEEH